MLTAERTGGHILVHGLVMVFVGLIWGLVVPQTPYPRLALTAHIQLTSNGLLLIVVAMLVLKLNHDMGKKSFALLVLSAWVTWPMLLTEMANSWWGTNQMLSIAAAQAGATGGEPWQEQLVQATHMLAGIILILAWFALTLGIVKPLLRKRKHSNQEVLTQDHR